MSRNPRATPRGKKDCTSPVSFRKYTQPQQLSLPFEEEMRQERNRTTLLNQRGDVEGLRCTRRRYEDAYTLEKRIAASVLRVNSAGRTAGVCSAHERRRDRSDSGESGRPSGKYIGPWGGVVVDHKSERRGRRLAPRTHPSTRYVALCISRDVYRY